MFSRVLLTAASLIVALAAAFVIDCSGTVIGVLGDDPIGACAAVESLGVDGGLWVGGGLGFLALLTLVATWAPAGALGRRLEPTTSLKHNLGRLAGIRSLGHEPVPLSVSRGHLAEMSRRLEIVETSLTTDASGSRRATELWMRLLRETNDLHNREELSTEDFKKINTRLVELFAPQAETKQDQAERSLAGGDL